MRWSNWTVSVFSKKLRQSGVSKNSRDRFRHEARHRSAARCCRRTRRAVRRRARRDKFAASTSTSRPAALARSRAAPVPATLPVREEYRRPLPEALRRPHQRDIDRAGEHKMRRQPILRDLDTIGEAGCHHPPADRALQRAKTEDQPEPRPQRRLRSSRATETRGTETGTPRRSAGRAADAPIPTRRSS